MDTTLRKPADRNGQEEVHILRQYRGWDRVTILLAWL